ncbi:uncharacterized protein DUF1302 [Tamilnaduibacter salinus]|uniref:Uncharacterized protein DUF1302 n=1 Tax=Tamilnaduibacter salinus TaxID=1484056 RepID=A0A2U1CUQ8_9GAMM|nr:DUF1302 domain-containing protein [Tamilnaduibacter salinus]PVY70780.1 uncharacterized protein DUF1302 [Tamilnaduibacter salinus]
MTRKTHQRHLWAKLPLAAAVAATMSTPTAAYQFYMGDVEASFDTTLTAGAGWRVEDPDKRLIARGNLSTADAAQGKGASTTNYDDGNLNFEKGKTYSKIVKGTSDLFLNYRVNSDYLTRVGGFARGRYYYDFELKDEHRHRDVNGNVRPLNTEAKKNASGAEFLDAYVFSDWYFGNVPVSIRYGKQVVSWGESTFIQGGVNIINPVDVNAIRAPGAQLKDALLPVEMLYTSAGITQNVSVEAFVQTDWEKVEPDDCGTFFSTNDFAPDGCGPVFEAGQVSEFQARQAGAVIDRAADRKPDDKDQFGAAVRWYVPALNDSELGLYYIKYNSRLPYVSGIVSSGIGSSTLPDYFIEYPENIDLYGLSINTTAPGGWSVGAEYSFRPNMPLQWNAFELLAGGAQLRLPNGQPVSLLERQRLSEAGGANLSDQPVKGYDRFKVSQAQMTLVNFFDQIMGASRMTFIGEVGATYVHDLPGYDEARYGRPGTFGIGTIPFETGAGTADACPGSNLNPEYCNNEGFTTDFSWGYVMRASWEYNGVYAGVNLEPQIAFAHDVQGYAPAPGGNFIEGSKSVGLSLSGTYQNRYEASIGYTNYFGGKPYNDLTDRDNVTASVSVSF